MPERRVTHRDGAEANTAGGLRRGKILR